MKSLIAILAFVFTSISCLAQHQHEDHGKSKWAELDAFHTVISQTFHPSEEGNLEPIKKRSAEMVATAKKLAASTPPQAYQSAEMKQAVKELVAQSEKMDKAVKGKKSDEALTEQLSTVHDAFHKISGLCSKEGDSH